MLVPCCVKSDSPNPDFSTFTGSATFANRRADSALRQHRLPDHAIPCFRPMPCWPLSGPTGIPILHVGGDHDISFPVENWYALNQQLPTLQLLTLPKQGTPRIISTLWPAPSTSRYSSTRHRPWRCLDGKACCWTANVSVWDRVETDRWLPQLTRSARPAARCGTVAKCCRSGQHRFLLAALEACT